MRNSRMLSTRRYVLDKKRIAPLCFKFCDTVLNIKIGTKRPAFFNRKNFKLGSLGVAKGVGIRASAMVPRDLSGKPARKMNKAIFKTMGIINLVARKQICSYADLDCTFSMDLVVFFV